MLEQLREVGRGTRQLLSRGGHGRTVEGDRGGERQPQVPLRPAGGDRADSERDDGPQPDRHDQGELVHEPGPNMSSARA